MDSLFGLELPLPMKFFIALAIVLILIGTAAYLLRRFGTGTLAPTQRNRQPRLAVVDATPIDNRRKLVIVRRDNVEHLLLIGGPSDVLIEPNIVRAGAQSSRDTIRPATIEPLNLSEDDNWPLVPSSLPARIEPMRQDPVRGEPLRGEQPVRPAAVQVPTAQVPPPQTPAYAINHPTGSVPPPMQQAAPPPRVAPPVSQPVAPAPVFVQPLSPDVQVAPPPHETTPHAAPAVSPQRPAPVQAAAPVRTMAPTHPIAPAHALPAASPRPPQDQPRYHAPANAAANAIESGRIEAGSPVMQARPPQAGPADEQNLADMAHRLEAALRRPPDAPAAVPPPAPGGAPAPMAAARPRMTPVAPPATGARQQAPNQTQSYENLQREMASLLGRQPGGS